MRQIVLLFKSDKSFLQKVTNRSFPNRSLSFRARTICRKNDFVQERIDTFPEMLGLALFWPKCWEMLGFGVIPKKINEQTYNIL